MVKLLILKQTATSSNSTDTLNNRTATLDAVSATLKFKQQYLEHWFSKSYFQ